MRRYAALIALALVTAACGDSGGGDGGATATTMPTLEASSSETVTAPGDQQGPPAAESDYPDVVVADLAGGQVNLKELALQQNPVLLWFWAPH